MIKWRTHSRRMTAIVCALSTLLVATFSLAQSPPQKAAPEQSSQSPITVRVVARLVQVNVIAQDRDGKPITDLTKDDFTVTDEGQAQKITFFSALAAPAALPVSAAVTSAPRRVFSNRRTAEAGVSSSVSVILLDAVNTEFKDMAYARAQVVKFVRQIHPEDRVALYLLTSSKLYILHDFTNDAATLERVMGGTKRSAGAADPDMAAADAANKRMNKALGDAFADANRYFVGPVIDRSAVTSEGMQDVAKKVAAIPGRKNLIWVSSGFPITIGYGRRIGASGGGSRGNFTETLSNAAKALNNANVSVYPVDARGLIGEDVLSVISGNTKTINGAAPDDRIFQTMDNIAAGTGGRAFYNGNDIAASIRHAIDDSLVSYAIGYYPDHNKWDGTFREINVKVNRPGISLRYRGGYFATPEGTDAAAQQKQVLADAVRSPIQLIDLGLEVHVEPVDAPGGHQLKVEIRVSPDQMHFEQNGDRWTDSVEVVWVELSADGHFLARGAHTLAVKPAQTGYDDILRDGLSFSEHVSVKSDAVEMRLVVRDAGSGATGSVNIPLTGLFVNSSASPVAH
jgi:VWFA-related protein